MIAGSSIVIIFHLRKQQLFSIAVAGKAIGGSATDDAAPQPAARAFRQYFHRTFAARLGLWAQVNRGSDDDREPTRPPPHDHGAIDSPAWPRRPSSHDVFDGRLLGLRGSATSSVEAGLSGTADCP